jgi:hypothetical protein
MTDQQTTDHQATDHQTTAQPATAQPDDQASVQVADPNAARPWFKYVRIIVPSAVVLLATITVVSTGGGTRAFDITTIFGSPKVASAAKIAPATATLGQSVRDSSFSFVVIRVNVTNIGYEPGALTATDQFLVSSKGERFATSSAISSLPGTEKVFKEKLNPGSTVNSAPLLFDVPTGTSIASIEFHDSLSSTGVKVKLP